MFSILSGESTKLISNESDRQQTTNYTRTTGEDRLCLNMYCTCINDLLHH